jgi:hypothetical protein
MEADPQELADEPEQVMEEFRKTVRPSVQAMVAALKAEKALPTTPEEVAQTVTTVVAAAPPPPAPAPPPSTGQAPPPATATSFTPPAGPLPGPGSFFPDDDATARGILGMVGGATDVVVVPNSFDLQPGNPAITLQDEGQVETYHQAIDAHTARFPGPDVTALKKRVVPKTILIKKTAMDQGQPHSSGIIWHEHGHVLHTASESGAVFAHEIDQVDAQLGTDTARWWVTVKRGLAYLARYAGDPGIADLQATLKRVLSEEDYAEYRRIYEHLGDKVAKKAEVILPNARITGTLGKLRAMVGVGAAASTIGAGVTKGDVISFGGIRWEVIDIDRSGSEPTYELRRAD